MNSSKRIIDLTVEELVQILVERLVPSTGSDDKGNQAPNHEILTINEVSEISGLSISTIYTKVSKGLIPSINRGKPLRFKRTEILDWLSSGMKQNKKVIDQVNEHLMRYGRKRNKA